ncbi:glycosyltransferase family 2 protein [uncultured Corynebacterium sp.]|uniref:glycosyltransferase family 2 protein n=1 Tax=uncultured Corynebacterium sp. TaxID=159447 RepID=UPI0025D2D5BD|nr:glycosyltransferase [uncultured Corynebacterium sp.]
MTDPDLDVVICTADPARLPVLRSCLDSVLAETRRNDRVVVVVDHCPGLVGQLTAPGGLPDSPDATGPTVCGNSGVKGLSGARDTGIRAGDNPVVCFIDDDAVPEKGWAGAVRAAFADPTVTGIGGRVVPRFTRSDGRERRRPRWVPASCDWIFGCDYLGGPADGEEIRNPIGAAMAVRREVLGTGDVFSGAFGRTGSDGAGGEETELFQRLTAGRPERRVVKVDGFRVRHLVPVDRTRPGYVVRRSVMEGRSKAAMSALPYTRFGEERAHLRRHLAGAVGELGQLVHGDPTAVARIVTGGAVVVASGLGFLTGRRGAPVPVPRREGGPVVSVILCTDARGPWLAETLAALAANTPAFSVEILLVDNSAGGRLASDPAVADACAADPRIRLVRAPVPGLSRARNVGVRAARGRVIAFTDDDAVPDPDWISRAVAALDRSGGWCVTGRVLPVSVREESHRLFESIGGFDKGTAGTTWTRSGSSGGRVPPVYPYPAGCFGSGNNMAFTRDCLGRLGGFAEELGAGRVTRGGEDLDMFRRVILAGGTIVYVPTMVVRHHHRDSRRALRRQMFGFGTGMAASLARCALDDRRYARDIVASLPLGLSTLLTSRRRADAVPGHVARTPHLPAHLVAVELLGYAVGAPLLMAALAGDAVRALGGGQ